MNKYIYFAVFLCFLFNSYRLSAQDESKTEEKKKKDFSFELSLRYQRLDWDPYRTDRIWGQAVSNSGNSNKIYFPQLKVLYQEKYYAELSHFKYYLGDFKYYYHTAGFQYPEYRIRNMNREETDINFIRKFQIGNHTFGAGAGWKKIALYSGTEGIVSSGSEKSDDRGFQINLRYGFDIGKLQVYGKYDQMKLSGNTGRRSFNLVQNGYYEFSSPAETNMEGYKAEAGISYSASENLKISFGYSKTFLYVMRERKMSALYYPDYRVTVLSYNLLTPETRKDSLKGFYISVTTVF